MNVNGGYMATKIKPGNGFPRGERLPVIFYQAETIQTKGGRKNIYWMPVLKRDYGEIRAGKEPDGVQADYDTRWINQTNPVLSPRTCKNYHGPGRHMSTMRHVGEPGNMSQRLGELSF